MLHVFSRFDAGRMTDG